MKKNILLIVAVLLFNISALAQSQGINIKNPSLDKFAGTWRFTSGNDTLIFLLWKENRVISYDFKRDDIKGRHFYKQGFKIIENSIYPSMANFHSEFTLLGGNKNGVDNDSLICFMDDISKKKNTRFIFIYDSVNNELIATQNDNSAGGVMMYEPGERPLPGYSLPNNFILKKVLPPPLGPPQ